MSILVQRAVESITGVPRHRPTSRPASSGAIVHRLFRMWESVAGRRCGDNGSGDTVRIESAAHIDEETGETVIQFFTVESVLAHVEGTVRNFIRGKIPRVSSVSVPMLSTPGFNLPLPAAGYLFAISAPTNNQANLTGFATANPPVVSMTPSGSDTVMMFYALTYSNGSGSTGLTTGASFNSQAATICGTELVINNAGGLGAMSMWYKLSPSATTANATMTISNSQGGGTLCCVVYSGVNQSMTYSGTPTDAYNSVSATGTNGSVSVTTVLNNSYVTGFQQNNGVMIGAGSGATARITDGGGTRVLDSGSAITPAGPFSLNWTNSSVPYGVVAASISPVQPSAPSGSFFLSNFM